MRIAQIAPLYESVPPRLYGGTERVVSYLTEELVALGHHVTLFASGDSTTAATLVRCADEALRLSENPLDEIAAHTRMLGRVVERADEFDVLHFHTDYLHLPLLRLLATPSVTTLHGRIDIPALYPVYRDFEDVPLVSISDSQRRPMAGANWLATVHHGLPAGLHRPGRGDGGYLAFLGRISPEKRPDRAIEIARRAGLPLRIAAKVSDDDRAYFEREIEPLLRGGDVDFVGEINEAQKTAFLGEARALLFPIAWPEPFGIAMIEALACGTPVVAFRAGSVPEVIDDGETGYIVESVDEAVRAVGRIDRLSRARCRQVFERRFTARRMAEDYLAVYARATGSTLDATDGPLRAGRTALVPFAGALPATG